MLLKLGKSAPKAGQDRFNPEAGLVLTATLSSPAGGTLDNELEAITDNCRFPTVFACDVVFPETPSDGTIHEKGGSGTGSWIGLRDGGTWFRVRAGEGQATAPGGGTMNDNDVAWIDTQDFPKDGLIHTVVWDVRTDAPGRVRAAPTLFQWYITLFPFLVSVRRVLLFPTSPRSRQIQKAV